MSEINFENEHLLDQYINKLKEDSLGFEKIMRELGLRRKCEPFSIKKFEEYITLLDIRRIPQKYDNGTINNMGARDLIILKQGFALLTHSWINTLVEYIGDKKCLEIMAGCGSLSKILKDKGVNIKTTDDFSWDGRANWNNAKNYWIEIENKDAIESIKEYGKDVDFIVMSWAYMDNTAYECLLEMRKINPNCKMIFIGEGWGGCTANDNFYENFIEIDEEISNKINKNYQQWEGIHDRVYIVK